MVDIFTISNNGSDFQEEDWERLATIASGNPDPQKVGMFGVGFYSVFALTDEPTVVSGTKAMKFCWQEQTLTCAKSSLKPASLITGSSARTCTVMPLKSERRMVIDSEEWKSYIAQLESFLLRLILFLRNVSRLVLQIDGNTILNVSKDLRMTRPISGSNFASAEGLFVWEDRKTMLSDLLLTAARPSEVPQIATFQLLQSRLVVQVCNMPLHHLPQVSMSVSVLI